VDLAYYRRLLHGIIVSEIDGKWDLFWAYAKQYLRKAGLDKVLDYKAVYKRVDELVRLVKSGMGWYGDERFFKHTVIPLEGVVSALSVRNDLAELVNHWDLIALGKAN
jgi:hypothetical protein